MEFTVDIHDVVYVHIDKKKKFPATALLRAFGYGTNLDILRLFYALRTLDLSKDYDERGLRREVLGVTDTVLLIASLPALVGFAFLFERHVLVRVIQRFDTIQEFVFLVAIGWCLGIAQLGHTMGLSYEMGAFIAGVALATSPIATFIAESLKPLRDFFLIMFFFALGAGFDVSVLATVAIPATVLALVMLTIKPLVFKALLDWEGEQPRLGREIGVRLGQVSEFSLLIALLAVSGGVIGAQASFLIQATTLLTFICSSYLIMFRYPTPIAVSESRRRD